MGIVITWILDVITCTTSIDSITGLFNPLATVNTLHLHMRGQARDTNLKQTTWEKKVFTLVLISSGAHMGHGVTYLVNVMWSLGGRGSCFHCDMKECSSSDDTTVVETQQNIVEYTIDDVVYYCILYWYIWIIVQVAIPLWIVWCSLKE